MPAFSIDMSSPFPSGFTREHGGPGAGGHKPGKWYIQFGMDLGADTGTEVFAAFSAHITKINPHNPSSDVGKAYGADLFMRSNNDMMGGYYTHITAVPKGIRLGTPISRGDLLGKVHSVRGIPPHLHFALVEIIGGAPGGRYVGVNLFKQFVKIANSPTVISVTFNQDGSPPTVT